MLFLSITQKIKLENEDTGKGYFIEYQVLEDYFKNPNRQYGESTLKIKIEPSFKSLDPSAEKENPFEEQLINKLKPVIKEMMRGNYG